ncbi:hypothetical protein BG015_006958 [Linnemannia schmuckeri]|uniref:Uncharacterized protein n=1 Tax=Linnemannia schmuckeri TaxID=64567 RepID=A0A9P5VBN6_9FUNG|nr:hypothetical protein BG015_006958 [Linnemannia schmuckeri]
MKPQLGQSKLAILKHAPTAYRKRRPIDLRNRHGSLLGLGLNNDYSTIPTAQSPGGPLHHTHNNNHGHNRPPALLRRQTTTRGHKSFMDIDLPSIRALRREPSMMELDPPTTLFAPTPSPAHFVPGPWAFFQAAEAQRAQRQAQIEFLTRLQELRARDEQCFVQLMAGFAKECPVQFAQLTGFMRRMENELAFAAAQEEQNNQNNLFLKTDAGGLFQQGQQQRRYSHTGVGASQDYWGRVQEHRESRGTKMGLLELAQLFGNQVEARSSHGEQFHRDQQQQHLQQLRQQYGGTSQSIDRRVSLGTIGTGEGAGGMANGGGKGGRHGHGRNGRSGGVNGQSRSASMPVLRRGKTFQQQQQAMQQLTAYQRQLYQHVQQTYQQQQQQQQQHLGYQSPLGNGSGGFVTSPIAIPLTHELMEYAAMTAAMSTGPASPIHSGSSVNNLPALINSLSSSPPSSLSSSSASSLSSVGPGSPLSPPNYASLMGQFQQPPSLSPQQQAIGLGGQSYFFQNQDPLELAAINMHMNMNSQGSSRRQRYKPAPVRIL